MTNRDFAILMAILIVLCILFLGIRNMAHGAIPPVRISYEEGGQLEDRIREAKETLSKQLIENGCSLVQIVVWRDGETIYIAAECLD